MGQNASKYHDPLTFGYVNRTDSGNSSLPSDPESRIFNDHILANPHLYQFEITCQQGCAGSQHQAIRTSGGDIPPETTEENRVFVAAELSQECKVCRRNKRLSLVRRDLAEDLAYIDKTYYPDVATAAADIHLSTKSSQGEYGIGGDGNDDDDDGGQWTKLTMNEVVAGTRRTGRRLSHASAIVVNLSGRSLIKMSPSIGYLDNITKLNLSHNQITALPETMGYIKSLEVLDASHNRLESLPDTVAYLSRLTELHVGFNRLKMLPASIGLLPKLKAITVNDNQLSSLPVEIAQLGDLVELDVSNNPLRALPVEIAYLSSLRKLVTEGCEFVPEFRYPLEHDPPSLVEICGRIAVRREMQIPGHLSDHIKEFLAKAQACSFCGGPFFESYVKRGRFIERSAELTIALEYRLCSSHWADDADRTVALFAPVPETAPLRKISSTIDDHVGSSDFDPILLHSPRPQRNRAAAAVGRHRGYSDVPARSHTESPQGRSYTSLPSQQSPSSSSSSSFPAPSRVGSPETISIRSLRSHPNLPALPDIPAPESGGSMTNMRPFNNSRARSSSTSSARRRLAAAILSPTPFTPPLSGSSLRLQQHWNPNEVVDAEATEEQDATTASGSHETTTQAGTSKVSRPRLLRAGLSGLGARFALRDRSETL